MKVLFVCLFVFSSTAVVSSAASRAAPSSAFWREHPQSQVSAEDSSPEPLLWLPLLATKLLKLISGSRRLGSAAGRSIPQFKFRGFVGGRVVDASAAALTITKQQQTNPNRTQSQTQRGVVMNQQRS